jgi:hypothetical protein
MNAMQQLAQSVVDELGLGHWEDDLIGREIGTAVDLAEAIDRIEEVRQDAVDALIYLHQAAKPPKPVATSRSATI